MDTSTVPGVSTIGVVNVIVARGTLAFFVVAKEIPSAVDTTVPAGTATELPVRLFENVTVPVAAVSTTFWPVASNVPSCLTSKDLVIPGTVSVELLTATTAGSIVTVKAIGPRGFSRTVSTTVALGQSWYAANAPATTMTASRPIRSRLDTPSRRRRRDVAAAPPAAPPP